jgi:hypothetical protein
MTGGGKVRIASGDDLGEMAHVRDNRLLTNAIITELPRAEELGPFMRYADTNGDGSGTKQAIGDYSGGEEFFFQPAAGQVVEIHRLMVMIQSGGSFRADQYGGLGAALGTGIAVQKRVGAATVLADYTDGIPIQTNAAWSRLSYDVTFFTFGAGDNYLACRWTFARSGQPVQLSPGQRLSIVLNDDLTGLTEHTFNFQGHRLT